LHLRAAVIERDLLAHQGLHAAHPGRKLRILDVQFDIHRKLADMASGAQVEGRERIVSAGLEVFQAAQGEV
jgi:hypothetical protein